MRARAVWVDCVSQTEVLSTSGHIERRVVGSRVDGHGHGRYFQKSSTMYQSMRGSGDGR
jgi:hypothetical protein